MSVNTGEVARLVTQLLRAIGEDPQRPGLEQTPQRVAALCQELFWGISADPAEPLRQTISVADAVAPQLVPSGAVVLRNIRFRSVCEHHLLPFAGVAHVAYLPGEQVVGLGSLVRVIETLAARPQVQERLGEQVADTVFQNLDASGVAVVLDASHNCVTMRGGRQPDATTLTVAVRGAYTDAANRAEIMALIGPGVGAGSAQGTESAE